MRLPSRHSTPQTALLYSQCVSRSRLRSDIRGLSEASRPGGAERASPSAEVSLRQNITERREDHVFVGVRLAARSLAGRRSDALPGVADVVGILHAVLNGALWPLVEAIPEANRALEQVSRVTRAIGQRAWNETRRAC